MDKKLLILGSIFGLLAVMLGAFAAHGLEKIVDSSAIESFQTGVRYQMYQALLLLLVGSMRKISTKTKKIVLLSTFFGVIFFSGSIYGLATDELSALNFKTIAFVTPIGGILMIISWLALLINFVKLKPD